MTVYVVEELEGHDDVTTFIGYRGAFATWEEAEAAAGASIPRSEIYGERITEDSRDFRSVRIIPMNVGERINRS